MSMKRSNVRAHSNVNVRVPGLEALGDSAFCRHARTREMILRLHPMLKSAIGIDWVVARASLAPFQLEVLESHFACPICGRWDRWPVRRTDGWVLSRTPFGCLCLPERTTELTD